MNRAKWQQLISRLPPGMTQTAAAKYLDLKGTTVRLWLLKLGYKFVDGRHCCWPSKRRRALIKFDADKVDWNLSNVALARKHGVSRERVRQVRERLEIKKVNGRK